MIKHNLPKNWQIKTLGEVCEITMGQSPKGEQVFSRNKVSICHSDLECNEREESHIVDSNRDISHFSNAQYDKENNLPQGWEVKTLGEVCEKVQKRSKDYKGLEFDYIDISSINNKVHTIEKIERYNVANAPSRAQQIVQSNDILFSNVRTYLKNIAFVNEKYNDCIASTGFCVIRTKKDILLPKFMFYQALSDKFVFSLNKLQRGSSYPAVRNSDIFMQNIVVPPLETQQKIVAKLESEFAKVERAKSHLEKVKEMIPRLKNSLLKSAFSGELTQSYKDKKSVSYCHCEDSSESEAIHNAQSPIEDSIAESKACKIVDCHELRCNSCNDESIAQTPNFTQAPNFGGATLVAQSLQISTNPPDCHLGHSETHKESICHSEALAEESLVNPNNHFECNEREESHIMDSNRDISHFSNAQYDNVDSCHSESPLCHSERSEESKSHFANTQYDKANNLLQGWEIKTLGEVSKINPKNKLDDDLEVSFIPMNLIADKYQNKFSYAIKTWKEVKKGYTHLQNNCIAIAKITPCFENGKCVILQDLKMAMALEQQN